MNHRMVGNRHKRWTLAFGVAGVAIYFALATYFHWTFVDPRPRGSFVIPLTRPYWRERDFAFRASNLKREDALGLAKIPADDPGNEYDTASPIQIYEGHDRLGPGHSRFIEISLVGKGRFAHWREQGIYFSSSDNTDPNLNGRRYWAVVP